MVAFWDVMIVIVKAAVVMGAVLQMASLITWVERKGSALIQNRLGANRASILGFDLAGLINTLLCDPVKALTKEDFVPRGTSAFLHSLAPFMAVFPVLISFAVIPFGPALELVGGEAEEPLRLRIRIGVVRSEGNTHEFSQGALSEIPLCNEACLGNLQVGCHLARPP